MIKTILSGSLVGVLLLLSGCGNNEGETALKTQQLLDKGNYTEVINSLESRAVTKGDYLTLASAYMGKAGFSLTSVVGSVSAAGTNANAGEFSSFVTSVQAQANNASLEDIGKAVEYYKKVVGNTCDDNNITALSGADADICLYIGLANVSQSAVAISYITDNVDVLSGTLNLSDDKLTASACAMQYAFNGTTNAKCTLSPKNDVTFVQSQKTYKSIAVFVNANEYEYLLTTVPNGSSVITKGYCTLNDFTTRVDVNPKTPAYHTCPVIETNSSKELTTETVLLSAVNGAIDAIKSAASDSLKQDIDKFKSELINRPNAGNAPITTQDLINYFNNKNK